MVRRWTDGGQLDMKAEFWAKKLNAPGYSYLNTMEVTEGAMEWKIPIRDDLNFVAQTLQDHTPMSPFRTFRRQHDLVSKSLGGLPRFLEI